MGLLLSFFLGLVAVHSMTIQASYLALYFSTPGAVILFFALVAILNPALRVSGKRPLVAAVLLIALGLLLAHHTTRPAPGMMAP